MADEPTTQDPAKKASQVQRAFEMLTQPSPKEWTVCQQQVLIENSTAENERLQTAVAAEKVSADNTDARAKEVAAEAEPACNRMVGS